LRSPTRSIRIRDALRIYGAGPGRWSSVGTGQLQNLPATTASCPSLIDAMIAGDRAALARWGNPLQVVSAISRAVCALLPDGISSAPTSPLSSRVLAWLRAKRGSSTPTGIRQDRQQEQRSTASSRAHAEQEHRSDQHGRSAEGQGHRSRLRLGGSIGACVASSAMTDVPMKTKGRRQPVAHRASGHAQARA
jgi:hypothetical protein